MWVSSPTRYSLGYGIRKVFIEPVPEPTTRELADFYREPGGIPGLESDDARNRNRPDPARWAKYRGWDVEYELPVETDDSDQEVRHADNRIRALLYPDQLEARLRRLRFERPIGGGRVRLEHAVPYIGVSGMAR